MQRNLAKNYDPKDFEDRIYESWEKEGFVSATEPREVLRWVE